MSSRRWCFTYNNYTADVERLIVEFFNHNDVSYGIYGREIAPGTGTPHLQGFCILRVPQRLSFLRNRIGAGGHYERAVASSHDAAQYCKKENDFVEVGTVPVEQGRRRDLDDFLEWGNSFIQSKGRAPTSPEVAKERPHEYLRYPRAINLFANRAPPAVLREGEPRAWQRDLAEEVDGPANDRTVIFYVDPEGGKGKSWFQQWYYSKNPHKTQILSIGKRDDLTYMVNSLCSVFFFNLPRNGMQFLQFSVLEQLKDRMVHSHKYQSKLKILQVVPHVIVFTNEQPPLDAMSEDRYDIRNIN